MRPSEMRFRVEELERKLKELEARFAATSPLTWVAPHPQPLTGAPAVPLTVPPYMVTAEHTNPADLGMTTY